MINDTELQEILDRYNATTPGDWWNESGVIHATDWRPDTLPGSACHPAVTFGSNGKDWEADAEFIAHAHQDIPKLLSMIIELRNRLVECSILLSYGSPLDRMFRQADEDVVAKVDLAYLASDVD